MLRYLFVNYQLTEQIETTALKISRLWGFTLYLKLSIKKLLVKDGCLWVPLVLSEGAIGQVRRNTRLMYFMFPSSWVALKKIIMMTSWPLRLSLHIRRYLYLFGEDVRLGFAVSKPRQVFDMYYAGLFFGIPAVSYYQYKLFIPSQKKNLSAYIYPHESEPMLSFLSNYSSDVAVDNKIEFALRCQALGINHIQTLAHVSNGKLFIDTYDWGAHGVVVKPVFGSRGIGVKLFTAQESGWYSSTEESRLSRQDVLNWLVNAGKNGDYLLQRLLSNHERLSHLSRGPLVTARIITRIVGCSNYQIIASVLQMPYKSQVTSNNGISAAIDIESGVIGPAFPFRPLHQGYYYHPDTRRQIAGTLIPFWDEVRLMVVKAHAYFPNHYSLGWDVAFTPHGPVLIETNAEWDVVMPQIAYGHALGNRLCSPPG